MKPYRVTPPPNTSASLRALPRVAALLAAAVTVLCLTTPLFAANKKAPPAKPAAEYPASETHPNEHVTIAIDPCNNQKDCDFFRLPYVAHSLIPVRVIITNDGDEALSLDEARFQFISANNDKIPAADLEEINRRMFTFKSTQGTKIPLIPITVHHPPVDKKVTDDDNDFGFRSTNISPHSTASGYLFYDIKSLDEPALKDAQIYIKMIYTHDRKQLFAFTIPLDKWLATQPQPAKR